MELLRIDSTLTNTHWNQKWGEDNSVKDYNRAYTLNFESKTNGTRLDLYFKVFKDGLGFRYEFPEQDRIDEIIIDNEKTEFMLTGDHTAWWIPARQTMTAMNIYTANQKSAK